MTLLGGTSYNIMSQPTSAAVDSAVDAYATKLLRQKSPPEAIVDENLGPYVTSMLRSTKSEHVEELPDFDSLMELLEEHCSLERENAMSVLSTILKAVRTGVMGETKSLLSSIMDGTQFLFEEVKQTSFSVNPQASDNYQSDLSFAMDDDNFTDDQPDTLIPVDLMGLIDDPSAPTPIYTRNHNFVLPEPEAFPPLGTSAPTPAPAFSTKYSGKPPLGTSAPVTTPAFSTKYSGKPPRNSRDGKDLAAVFFRPRSRQHSIDEQEESTSADNDMNYQTEGYDYYQQQQIDSAIDMLLSMNPDLTQEAAAQAAVLGSSDANIAQYVIDGATSAPPVCRHMMSDGCYRSDCQFSHDVDGHTCLFWLRGRCGKRDSCKFRHGFSEKLLAGFEASKEVPVSSHSKPVAIATKNLLRHNAMGGTAPVSILGTAPISIASSWASGGGQSWEPSDFGMSSLSLDNKPAKEGFSFASIASKGYKNDSFTSKGASPLLASSLPSKPKSVKIPQDLWNQHINRNSRAFNIQDPLERCKEVSKSVTRDDVVDLHFQSTKTFPIVLSTMLPQKLREHDEVWIVSAQKVEAAVLTWLEEEGYSFVRGRDRNGHCGALLVKNR